LKIENILRELSTCRLPVHTDP